MLIETAEFLSFLWLRNIVCVRVCVCVFSRGDLKSTGYLLSYKIDPIWKISKGFPGGSLVKNLPEMQVLSLDWENLLEMEMAIHSSILTWRIPWTEEPGRLQSIGLQKSQT